MINRLKKEKVLCIALILAVVSAFFVHPDRAYAGYVDVRVLALLFCLMLLVKGFQDIGLLDRLILWMFGGVRNSRWLCLILILLCFFSSMLVTNDVALLTFVPFALLTLKRCGQDKLTIRVVVLQTMAANLGSMFTPIGNPQNLYLFSVSGMSMASFWRTMFPVTLLSLALLLAAVLSLPGEAVQLEMRQERQQLPKRELIVYCGLFLLNLLVVFRLVSWKPVLAITIAAVLGIGKRKLLLQVDYALLLTFAAFFVLVGNIGRISIVSETIARILSGREILVSALFSQVLSNVPAAILLSGFTEDFAGLLVGTNIGGLGTLIASMASLISYKLYAAKPKARKGEFMLIFTLYNVFGLIVLLTFAAFYYGTL